MFWKKYTDENEGHDGSIWSGRVRWVYALLVTLLLALMSYAPSLAGGSPIFGK